MDKSIWWSVMIRNSVSIICWTILAIIFNKWWVALFAVLFVASVEYKTLQRYYRVCDKCGKHSPYAESYNEALEKAKEAGWIHCVDGNKDYCPECQ